MFNAVITYSIIHEQRFASIWLFQFQSSLESVYLVNNLVQGNELHKEK